MPRDIYGRRYKCVASPVSDAEEDRTLYLRREEDEEAFAFASSPYEDPGQEPDVEDYD